MPIASNELRNILTFDDLIQYLDVILGWPLRQYDFDQLTFEYLPEELGLKDIEAAKIGRIHQLRPLSHSQPWGIFFVEFEKKKLPVVVLRRILSHLVLKKRASANKSREAAWDTEDLLFITAFGEVENQQREIAFAHFHQTPGDLPTLRVLGWDGADTPLKLAHVDTILREQLLWPDNPSDLENWRQQWRKPFKHRIGHVINKASMLAEVLAVLARGIRDRALRMLSAESEKGPLRKLHKAFQTSLIHDLTEESFADTYAQTITYGLLTAAISQTDDSRQRTGTFIADNLHDLVPITNPFLREILQTFLKVGGRKGGIDFDELGIQDVVELLRSDETDLPAILRDFGNRTHGEDPVIHFYEHFLTAYNKQLKIQRGAFYTPQPVVSYIIRSVHELLQTEFGIEDGLASTVTWGEMKQQNPDITIPRGISPESPFVMMLDIATGTGTFLVEVIDVIHKTMTIKWLKQGKREQEIVILWNEYVPKHLLPRLYGYELMMAPYTIAHMKIGLKLFETGYLFMSDERVRVYLTNTLEPPSDRGQQSITDMFPALAHEAQAVNEVKRSVRFTVVVGNPPYSGHSANKGEWATKITDAYYKIEGIRLKEANTKWLQDDYVKFIRLSQLALQESGIGVIGLITNHGYIDNPTFRAMRYCLIKDFRINYHLHLNGSAKKAQDGHIDQNVFDIQQGVAISLLLLDMVSSEHKTWFFDFIGSRENKYEVLQQTSYLSTAWSRVTPNPPFYLFIPESSELRTEFQSFSSLTDVMPQFSLGCLTKRDGLVIGFSEQEVRDKILTFIDNRKSTAQAASEFGLPIKDKDMWDADFARKSVSPQSLVKFMSAIDYRIWDTRYLFAHKHYIARLNRRILSHMENQNLALVSVRQLASLPHQHFWVVNRPSEQCVISTRTKEGGVVFPLYLYEQEDELGLAFDCLKSRNVNYSPSFIKLLESALGLEDSNFPSDLLTPEDIFHYAYAVFHSPGYRKRYAEFLKIDFPRVPVTTSPDLFRFLGKLGSELVALHLMESPKLVDFITAYIGPQKPEVGRVGFSDYTVWLDAASTKKGQPAKPGTIGFRGVPENVWNFHIGGYRVCEKWLKDRKGRRLSEDDINHYHRIVLALSDTIRIMGEIDEVIDAHGGWPNAFVASK